MKDYRILILRAREALRHGFVIKAYDILGGILKDMEIKE